METFFVMTPGGFEVQARAETAEDAVRQVQSDWQTRARVVYRDGSDRVLQSASGKMTLITPGYSTVDQDKIQSFLDGVDAGKLSRDAWDRDILEQAGSMGVAQEFVRGTPFVGSMTDEAMGAIDAALGRSGTREKSRALTAAMQRQRPGTTVAANLAGGAVIGAPLAAAAAPAKAVDWATRGSRIARAGKGALVGASAGLVEGGIYGAGEGQAGTRGKEAARGAAFGAGFGGLLGGAAPVVGDAAANVWNAISKTDERQIAASLRVSPEAARVIRQVQIDGGSVSDAVSELRRAGATGMLADGSLAARALLDAVTTGDLNAANLALGRVDQRASQAQGFLTDRLDDYLGFPTGTETQKAGIRSGTAATRGALYDEALAQGIDWRSPAGERLDALLKSAPEDAMRRAQRFERISRRADILPDYSAEFAPDVSTASGMTDEARQVADFFAAYREAGAQTKRPMSAIIKSLGGVSPTGQAADDLRAMGVTSRTHPALFRQGGLQDLDNIGLDLFPDTFRLAAADDTGNYASRQAIIDALADEARGGRISSAADDADARMMAEMDQMLPEMEARRAELEQRGQFQTAPPEVSDAFQVSTIGQADQIKRALQDMKRAEGAGLLGGTTDMGREYGLLAAQIRDQLVEMSPVYGDALAAGADAIARTEAVDFGASLLAKNTTREAVADFVRTAGPGEIEAARQGLRTAIDEIMANVSAVASDPNVDAREVAALIRHVTSRASKEKMRAILGADAAQVFDALDQAQVAATLRAGVAQNSRTAVRGAVQEQIGGLLEPGLVGHALRGEPVAGVKDVIRALTGVTKEMDDAARSKVYQELSDVLTRSGTDDAVEALRTLERFRNSGRMSESERAQVARAVASAGGLVGAGLLGRGVASEGRAQ